ncbi:AraC family transcriptional regulator [Amphibacillus jilinensis]|uniref:AraC family transcriptional regulator n=1 Tax=Amphibacillus jilinensis TaxID=1216008 RepID=UPI0002E61123|nr:AraC family transcriptional regulator [Amphibacillus jilinensis]
MNPNQLEDYIRPLNEKEIYYKQNPTLSKKYQELDQIDHNGEMVYLFNTELMPDKNILIFKQNRFAPVPTHIHSYLELIYVYSGKCDQIINGRNVRLKKGQICIIDTEVPHSIQFTDENDTLINFLIRQDFFTSSFLSKLNNKGIITNFLINAISNSKDHDQYIIFHSEQNENIQLLTRQVMCEFFDQSICSDEMIDAYMLLIFSELIRVFHYDSNQTSTPLKDQINIIDILQFIEENYQYCTLNDVAKRFNYNPNYLSTLIKKQTGKSFKELIQLQRLSYSSFLLINTEKPIYQIAEETGHSNLSYFYSKFKNFFGMTPQQYRDNR